jgi:hypothetical protein
MPDRSKSQKRLMGMAYAYKKGEFKGEPSRKIKDLADQMSLKDLKDFARTKENDLSQKVEGINENTEKLNVVNDFEKNLNKMLKQSLIDDEMKVKLVKNIDWQKYKRKLNTRELSIIKNSFYRFVNELISDGIINDYTRGKINKEINKLKVKNSGKISVGYTQEIENMLITLSIIKNNKRFKKTVSEIKLGEENNMTVNKKEIKKLANDIMSEGCKTKRKKRRVSEERSVPIKERFNLLSRSIFENNELLNIGQKVSDLTEKASDTILSESDGDWFDNHTLKRNASEITKKGHEFNKNAVELKKIFERMQALYEEIGMLIERYL